MPQLNLNKAEIQKLNYERFYFPDPIIQKRIHAVFMKATTEFSNEVIGILLDLDRHTVGNWISAYKRDGYEALCQFNYGTNKSELETHSEDILKSFTQTPPRNVNEAKSRIEQMTGISRSPSQVRAFMKRHELCYLRTGHIRAKADADKQRQWVKSTLNPAIRQAQKGKCHLLFVDASHFILCPFLCALWCIRRIFIKAASGRNRINVLGAVDAITKEVITCYNTTYIGAQAVVEFLKQLRKHYGDLPLKIVLDNARYQHCELVKNAAEQLNITLLFLPPYSPNLNIIERLWKFTKKTLLYGKYYDTPAKFHEAISGFFQTVNQNYNTELKNLMTLKFQFFDENHGRIYPN
jgi:transposase